LTVVISGPMKKIVTVIGARPQFVKEAPFSKVIRRRFEEVIVHTGQHYDDNMSRIFFEEMGIPRPDVNLEIGSGSHGQQTARILEGVERVLLVEKPDYVVVFGDTNSTLAGALAAVKLHIPVGHIEAGLRSFNRRMPEEINRIMTDSVADQLFCPTQHAVDLLAREGVTENVYLTGDIMFDAVLHFLPRARESSDILRRLGLEDRGYHLMTVHRAENTDDILRFVSILEALRVSDRPVVFPRHPRLKGLMERSEVKAVLRELPHLMMVEPVGFLDMIMLEASAGKILTDSGGVQKEAYYMRRPCITLRDETEWVETVDIGWNVICGADREKISGAIRHFDGGDGGDRERAGSGDTQEKEINDSPYGEGRAAEIIGESIGAYLEGGQ